MKMLKGTIFSPKSICAIALTLLMALSMLTVTPIGKADTSLSRTTYIFAAAAPNPIGIGQTIYLSFLIANVPPSVIPVNAPHYFFWSGCFVTLTYPDGTVKNMTGLTTGDAGIGTITFVPSEVGNYTMICGFGGETIPSGASAGAVYSPSVSAPTTFTVQQTPITGTMPGQSSPLPTAYWTFPIDAENQGWNVLSGNWLAGDFVNASQPFVWNPYTDGPYSGHILWSQPWVIGGLAGGNYESNLYQFGRWPGGSDQYFCPYIANGIMYVNLPDYYVNSAGANQPQGFEAINLATDKILWTQTAYNDSISYLQVLSFEDSTMATGTYTYLWDTSGTTWKIFDPLTGNLVQQITGAASGGKVTFGPSGELEIYYVNANGWLAAWNSTQFELSVGQTVGWANSQINTPNIVYQVPIGSYNFTLGYQWNITIAKQAGIGFTNGVYPGNMLICSSSLAATPTTSTALEQIAFSVKYDQYKSIGYNIQGLGAIQADTGNQQAQVLWGPVNRTTFVDNSGYERIETSGYGNNGVPYFAIYPRQTLSINVYNALTGQLAYSTTPFSNTFALFDGESNNIQIADGKMFACGYDGTMYCWDLATGKQLWSYYVGNAGTDTAYGTWPIDGSYSYYTIAGGVIYMGANEHSPNNPTWLGGQIWAVNETSGQLIWKIDSIQDETQPIAVVGGQAIYLNFYDGKLYDIGKGPSATTLSAPQIGVTTATPITITGTVMDKSLGTTQPEQAGDFPTGMPCVSDASMSAFMEAAYMQQPMPNNITGVPVTLSVLDSNGNYRTIGTTTTNAQGTYGFTWTPDITGNYTVYATFAGSQSYYGSSASTYIYASSPAATAAPTATPLTGLASNTSLMYGVVAIIIVIVIIGAVLAMIMLRKRP